MMLALVGVLVLPREAAEEEVEKEAGEVDLPRVSSLLSRREPFLWSAWPLLPELLLLLLH